MLPINRQYLTTKSCYPNQNKPGHIVVHETACTGKGLNALHFAKKLSQEGLNGTVHYWVDDHSIYQSYEHCHGAWHVGYSNYGKVTNTNSVGIEICVNSDGDYKKARQNAIELVAHLKKQNPSWTITKHNDCAASECPYNINKEGYWPTFLEEVDKIVNGSIDFDAVATTQCIVELTDAVGSGMLDPLELCKIESVEPGTYRRTVTYQGWDRVKTGIVTEGSVYLLEDAYNYYNTGDTLQGYEDKELTKPIGVIYNKEEVCVASIENGIAYLRFDSAKEGKLMHLGYCKADTLCKIGEEPTVPEVPQEPEVPSNTEKLYRVQVGAYAKENAEKVVADLKEKGYDPILVEV